MGNFFEWDQAKFTVRVSEMDREHQTLIGLMNKLHVLYSDKAPKADVGRALDELAKYTIKHFADEEAYMAKIHFDGLDMHKRIHKELLTKVTNHIGAFQASGSLNDDFFAFLKMWLKSHICGIDIKYGLASAK